MGSIAWFDEVTYFNLEKYGLFFFGAFACLVGAAINAWACGGLFGGDLEGSQWKREMLTFDQVLIPFLTGLIGHRQVEYQRT
ncbi:hypothetical protein CQ006_27770 [Pseudomonas cedrina]|uniref:Uncharacterized protein n=1 Tax=Pseudomonas cedrina TaxID=651740 RepID=A0A2S9D3H7_PSECE|nr:hypothetical protein CQ006_27770 [Pseudomonas cedrina]